MQPSTVPVAQPAPKQNALLSECLVSIAIIAQGEFERVEAAVAKSAAFVESRFEFFELLIIVHASDYDTYRAGYDRLLKHRNSRCVILRNGTGEYRAALVAATESIGDIVLTVLATESAAVDLEHLFSTAISEGGSVMLRRKERAGALSRLGGAALSWASGYDVDPCLLRSSAHARAQINRIASRSDKEIALRFLPKNGRGRGELSVIEIQDASAVPRLRPMRRLGTAIEILASAPPHLLRLLAAISFLVMAGAVLFFLYAVALFVIGYKLQPGWLTTSVAISGSTAFISLALGGIATGLYQVLNLIRDDTGDEIIRQIDNTDLFRDVGRINVETRSDD
jgi:hypothetical protein